MAFQLLQSTEDTATTASDWPTPTRNTALYLRLPRTLTLNFGYKTIFKTLQLILSFLLYIP